MGVLEWKVGLWIRCGVGLTNSVLESHHWRWPIKFGEELVNTNEDDLLFDPEVKPRVNEDLGDGKACLLPLHCFPIRFTIGEDRVVQEADVGGIGSGVSNHSVWDFLFHFSPCELSKHESLVDFSFRKESALHKALVLLLLCVC